MRIVNNQAEAESAQELCWDKKKKREWRTRKLELCEKGCWSDNMFVHREKSKSFETVVKLRLWKQENWGHEENEGVGILRKTRYESETSLWTQVIGCRPAIRKFLGMYPLHCTMYTVQCTPQPRVAGMPAAPHKVYQRTHKSQTRIKTTGCFFSLGLPKKR